MSNGQNNIIEMAGLSIKSEIISFHVSPSALAVKRGAFCALVGRSGAGKSVLMSLLTGHLLHPWMGINEDCFACETFNILGNTIGKADLCSKHKLRNLFKAIPVVYMPQKLPEDKSNKRSTHSEMTDIAEAIAPHCNRRVLKKKIEARFKKHDGLQETLRKPLSSLSGGQRKRVEILARVVGAVEKTKGSDSDIVFLLDEPTTGLDTKTRRKYFDFLKTIQRPPPDASKATQEQVHDVPKTFIVATHAMELLDEKAGVFDTVLYVRKQPSANSKDSSVCELAFCGPLNEFNQRKDLLDELR